MRTYEVFFRIEDLNLYCKISAAIQNMILYYVLRSKSVVTGVPPPFPLQYNVPTIYDSILHSLQQHLQVNAGETNLALNRGQRCYDAQEKAQGYLLVCNFSH